MNRLILTLFLAMFAAAAFAQQAVVTTEPAKSEPAAQNDGKDKTAHRHDGYCVGQTGSRIPRKEKDGCIAGPGNSYSQDDLRRTGQVNTADALRTLDVSISGH